MLNKDKRITFLSSAQNSGILTAIQTTLVEIVDKQTRAPSEVFQSWKAVSMSRLLIAPVDASY